jgi:hypothetical protein
MCTYVVVLSSRHLEPRRATVSRRTLVQDPVAMAQLANTRDTRALMRASNDRAIRRLERSQYVGDHVERIPNQYEFVRRHRSNVDGRRHATERLR